MLTKFKNYVLTPLVALCMVIAVAIGVNHFVSNGDQPRSLNGTWQMQIKDQTVMTAHITTNHIEISFSSPDANALYWKGTFPAPEKVAAGAHITSIADKDALSRSILGSMSDTKDFTYEHGKLNFWVTMFGVTKLVSLEG